MGMAKPKEEVRNEKLPGPMHILQTVYFRFSNIAKWLTKLMEVKQAFQCTPEVEVAFQTLKEALCTAPILAYLQPRQRFVIDTDASNVGIGVLSQVQDGQERLIAYYSKKMKKAERNYCVT
jgi:hypothetical protein